MNKKTNYFGRLWNWRRKSAGGLPSTETNLESSATSPLETPSTSPLSNTYHRSCETLPYSHFIEISVNGNLRWLVISGKPDPQDLFDAWTDIIEEYGSIINTDKSDSVFDLYKKIEHTKISQEIIKRGVFALKLKYDQELAALVSSRGLGIVASPDDHDQYIKSLIGIEISAKLLVVLLNQYNAEYQQFTHLNTSETPLVHRTMLDYEKELAIMSRNEGYRIPKEKISTLQWCAIVNTYIEKNKRHLNSKNNG